MKNHRTGSLQPLPTMPNNGECSSPLTDCVLVRPDTLDLGSGPPVLILDLARDKKLDTPHIKNKSSWVRAIDNEGQNQKEHIVMKFIYKLHIET